MSKKISAHYHNSLVWPNECIICGSNNIKFIKTSKAVTTGIFPLLFWITIHSRSVTIQYPVCNKHNILVKFLIPLIFLTSLILIILFAYSLINYGFSTLLVFIFLLLSVLFLLFLYKIQLPFYIAKVGPNIVSFVIRNNTYAQKFENLNKSVLIKKT